MTINSKRFTRISQLIRRQMNEWKKKGMNTSEWKKKKYFREYWTFLLQKSAQFVAKKEVAKLVFALMTLQRYSQ